MMPWLLATLLMLSIEVTSVRTQRTRIGDSETIANGIVTPPQAVRTSTPSYTPEARMRGIKGTVTVEAEFDIDGNFTILRIVKGLGYGLDEKALEALSSWQFLPAMRNGARVSVIARIDIGLNPADDFRAMTAATAQFASDFNGREDLVQLRAGSIPLAQATSGPEIIERTEPQYSTEAHVSRYQGTVILEVAVLEDGTAKVVRIIQSLGFGLDQNAVKAIETWRFQPAMKDGRPVKVLLPVQVNFNLRPNSPNMLPIAEVDSSLSCPPRLCR
jgi:TonB family protein